MQRNLNIAFTARAVTRIWREHAQNHELCVTLIWAQRFAVRKITVTFAGINKLNMSFSSGSLAVFNRAITDYHASDNVDTPVSNPFPFKSIDYYLYLKSWIDTVQWHLEDIIRDPDIDPVKALAIKRRIDRSNQERTDLVELIDSYFLDLYKDVKASPDAAINTESPAWAVDRLSILALKIYHMSVEASRTDVSREQQASCRKKLDILLVQRDDLSQAIDQLLDDIAKGKKYMKVYRQMKMYNDPSLNPVLYGRNGK